jgi:hypothetical protein
VIPALYALTGVTTVREMRGKSLHGASCLWAADVVLTIEVRDAAGPPAEYGRDWWPQQEVAPQYA